MSQICFELIQFVVLFGGELKYDGQWVIFETGYMSIGVMILFCVTVYIFIFHNEKFQ